MTVKITLDRKTLDAIGVKHLDDETVTPKQIAAAIAPEIEKILHTAPPQVRKGE